jgi:hypothetical protein
VGDSVLFVVDVRDRVVHERQLRFRRRHLPVLFGAGPNRGTR